MGKHKTVSGAKKRFKAIGGRGKKRAFKFRRNGRNHILRNKSQKVKRKARRTGIVKKSDSRAISRMLAKE